MSHALNFPSQSPLGNALASAQPPSNASCSAIIPATSPLLPAPGPAGAAPWDTGGPGRSVQGQR